MVLKKKKQEEKQKKTPAEPPPPLRPRSVLGVDDPLGRDRKRRVPLRQRRARDDLGHALLSPSLLQPQPRRRRVRHDVPPDRLDRGPGEHRPSVEVGRDDLVGDDDGAPELLGELGQRAQEAAQVDLARRELPAAVELGAVQGRDRVDDDEREARLGHHRRRGEQELALVVGVVRAGVGDVVEDVGRVEPEALGDLGEARRAERALGVDPEGFTLGASLVDGELAGDAERVAELGLAAAVWGWWGVGGKRKR